MANKQYFTKREALEDIKECLEGGYNGYYCDLHNEVFNTDYYIIGTYEAKEALKQYDVFEAIEKVETYEKENFGSVETDLHNPERFANMLYYIIGDEAMQSKELVEALLPIWDNEATEENNEMLSSVIDRLLIKEVA